jgi:hypothetical protein
MRANKKKVSLFFKYKRFSFCYEQVTQDYDLDIAYSIYHVVKWCYVYFIDTERTFSNEFTHS